MIEAIAHELSFWKEFVKTTRFQGWISKKKTPEFNPLVYDFIQGKGKVLDIGSGVISLLNGSCDVTATDPLSPLYELIFDYKKYKLTPPLPYSGETIPFIKEFDIVHISNALDHAQDPKKVFDNMIRASKKYVIVQGFENEAIHEKYQGFHQYNVTFDKSLKISDKENKVFDSKDFPVKLINGLIHLTELNRNWIICIFQVNE